jgi:transcriptional regulator of acetoin/glycerol metabolism
LTTGLQYFAAFTGPESRKALSSERRPESESGSGSKRNATEFPTLEQLSGSDPQMQQNVACAKRVMNKGIPILLIGETGTGKEVFARAVHEASTRAARPFVALNCASIPESLIESELFGYKPGAFTGAHIKGMRGKILQSDGGTLFLDEIGDMPLNLQTRMLRVLAEKEIVPLGSETPVKIDLSVICATLRNLDDLVRRGEFREDLYFRLNGVTIVLPPLRDRKDRKMLIRNILASESGGRNMKISPDALEALLTAPWPGNIRELRNALRYAQAVNESGTIGVENLPLRNTSRFPTSDWKTPSASDAPPGMASSQPDESEERLIMLEVLTRANWNISKASRQLGVSRPTLYKKMKQHGVAVPHKFNRARIDD